MVLVTFLVGLILEVCHATGVGYTNFGKLVQNFQILNSQE